MYKSDLAMCISVQYNPKANPPAWEMLVRHPSLGDFTITEPQGDENKYLQDEFRAGELGDSIEFMTANNKKYFIHNLDFYGKYKKYLEKRDAWFKQNQRG